MNVSSHLAKVLRDGPGAPRYVGRDAPPVTVDIEVHPMRRSEMGPFAQAHRFTYAPGNDGYMWFFWDRQGALEKAYVMLARDRLQGDELRHFAMEEITQALGFPNDAPHFADSIFFSRGGSGGRALAPSPLDEALMRFVYAHLAPGDGIAAFRAAFARHGFSD